MFWTWSPCSNPFYCTLEKPNHHCKKISFYLTLYLSTGHVGTASASVGSRSVWTTKFVPVQLCGHRVRATQLCRLTLSTDIGTSMLWLVHLIWCLVSGVATFLPLQVCANSWLEGGWNSLVAVRKILIETLRSVLCLSLLITESGVPY